MLNSNHQWYLKFQFSWNDLLKVACYKPAWELCYHVFYYYETICHISFWQWNPENLPSSIFKIRYDFHPGELVLADYGAKFSTPSYPSGHYPSTLCHLALAPVLIVMFKGLHCWWLLLSNWKPNGYLLSPFFWNGPRLSGGTTALNVKFALVQSTFAKFRDKCISMQNESYLYPQLLQIPSHCAQI